MGEKTGKKKWSTSKIVLLVVFILCIEIVIFCEVMMNKYGDLSAMYALIGVPATLIPTVCAYMIKSKAENTQGGITYDMAMLERQQQFMMNNDEPVG